MYIHKHGNETAQTVIILHPMGITGEKMYEADELLPIKLIGIVDLR